MASASCVFAFNAFQGLLFCSKSIRPCDLRLSHFQSFAKPENTRRRLKFAFAAGLQFDWLRLGNFTTFKWHIFLFGRIQSNHTGDEQPCSDTSPLLSDYAFAGLSKRNFAISWWPLLITIVRLRNLFHKMDKTHRRQDSLVHEGNIVFVWRRGLMKREGWQSVCLSVSLLSLCPFLLRLLVLLFSAEDFKIVAWKK